jgi:hypothetical protein
MKTNWSHWQQIGNITSKEFICGYCDCKVGSNHGYFNSARPNDELIYICTNCGLPSLFFNLNQYPGPALGRIIKNLPEDVGQVYKEIRDSIKNASYTAATLLGRKLIMHLAVDIAKAVEGLSFAEYIDYLKKSNFIPPNGDKILEYIKNLGNEKNHELKIGKKEEAEKILRFIKGLLIFIYEFPSEFNQGSPDIAK